MADSEHAPDLMAALAPLLPQIAERAPEIENVRRLPADLAQKLANIGVFRMVTPAYLGGLELSPREIVEVTEAVATADASVGWCTMIGATTALNAAYMSPDAAHEVYNDPKIITGGVFAPMGKAWDEGDHFRVTGRWQWGSGSANCTWLCGGCMVYEDDKLLRLPSGAPENRMMVFPASEAELIDTWHTMGLQGTGSGDIAVTDIKVPKGRSVSLVADAPTTDSPLFKFPAFGLLSLGVAAAAMGNARGALTAFKDLALGKKNQGSRKTLAERAPIQIDYAKMDAALNAARAYLFHEIDQTWDVAQNTDGEIPMERRADLRLACTHMVRTAADVCRTAHDLAGGVDVYSNSEIQRRFRDAHAMTAHIVTAPATYELIGRILLDQSTDGAMV
ncbi:MAG: acyl-CoA dehydrogenase family protein [Pseudomonadota bacterium]